MTVSASGKNILMLGEDTMMQTTPCASATLLQSDLLVQIDAVLGRECSMKPLWGWRPCQQIMLDHVGIRWHPLHWRVPGTTAH